MLEKNPGNVPENPGNVQEDSGNVMKDLGECYQRFCGMFKKIPNQNHILLKKANVSKFRRREIIFATSNETIKRSNKMV